MTIMIEKIKLPRHPHDHRIVQTYDLAMFQNAAHFEDCSGAILQRAGAEKQRLKEIFAALRPSLPKTTCLVYEWSEAQGMVRQHFPALLDPIRTELDSMANIYNAMSGVRDIELMLCTELMVTKNHPHEYDVANCDWGFDGTLWDNEAGKTQQAGEGNIFFFKEGLLHRTDPRAKESQRVLVVALPLEAA